MQFSRGQAFTSASSSWLSRALAFAIRPAGAITIVPTFDSSITSDPNAATIEASINAAIQAFEQVILDPITVTIKFQETSSGLGQNSTYIDPVPYNVYYSALVNHATSPNDTVAVNHLPNSVFNPLNHGPVNLQLPNAWAGL